MIPLVPQLRCPPGACDCHVHIYDARFPLSAQARRLEPDALLSDYQRLQQSLGLERVVLVQPSAYGADNSCMLEALRTLGARGRGVAVINDDVTDAALRLLTDAGIKGARFRMTGDLATSWNSLAAVAPRIAAFGWHIQFQMDGRQLHTGFDALQRLPCTLVVEHIGKFLEPVEVGHPGFQALLRLLDTGRVWVKLSGSYMMSNSGPPEYTDVGVLAKALVAHAPERMVWGSDWPHPLAPEGAMPDDARLLDLLLDWAPDEATRRRILVHNPAALYGFV